MLNRGLIETDAPIDFLSGIIRLVKISICNGNDEGEGTLNRADGISHPYSFLVQELP